MVRISKEEGVVLLRMETGVEEKTVRVVGGVVWEVAA